MMMRRIKTLMILARWRAVAIAVAALMLSSVAGMTHGDSHGETPKKTLATHEHHDPGTTPDHNACDLTPACGAKVLAKGSGALTIYENPWRSVMRMDERPIPNGHVSRPAHPPPRTHS